MDAVDPSVGASAGTGARKDPCNVARAIAEDGRCLAVKGGDDKLSPLAVGQHLACCRVDDLAEEVVFCDMEPLLCQALHGDTRSHGLCQAIDIEDLVVELLLKLFPEVVGECLCAVDADTQMELAGRIDAHGDGRICDMHGIARRAAEDGRAHLAHDPDLALGVAGRDGYRRASCCLGTIVGTEAAREEAIAIGNLRHIVRSAVGIPDATGEALSPEVQVMLCIGADGRYTGRAGGDMDLAHFGKRHGKHAIRIGIPQVLLRNEGSLLHIIEAGDGIGIKARLVEALLVEGDLLVTLDGGLLDSLELQRLNLVVRQRQDVFLRLHASHLSVPNSLCAEPELGRTTS